MKLILLFLLLWPQDDFTRFTYCREQSRGPYETQCIQLDPQGSGESRLKLRGAAETKTALTLSPAARDRFMALLTGTRFLADGAKYESEKKVADLGLKRLVLEMPSGRREASFNFSTLKEVTSLSTFFDALINYLFFYSLVCAGTSGM